MKRFLGILLLICVFCSMMSFAEAYPVPVETEDEYKAELELPADDIKVSDVVYLTLSLNCRKPVFAFEANIEYDKDQLSYKEADLGSDAHIKIEDNQKGKLMFALSAVGEDFLAERDKDLCTFSFKAKKSGKVTFKLTSVTVVFDDMTYFRGENLDEVVSLKIKSLSSGGGSSGSSSSGGSSISISKPVTSTGSDIPPEPQITVPKEEPQEQPTAFKDLDNDFWGYTYIMDLSSKGILNGYSDGSFMPESPITRAEFSKLVYKAFNIQGDESIAVSFDDVDNDDWHFECVSVLSSMGIIKGENGSFYPEREITREEAATVIKRCADFIKAELKPVRENIDFADETEISDFAAEYIDSLYMSGIVSGNDTGYFSPKDSLSRAEAAAMVYNLLYLLGGEAL